MRDYDGQGRPKAEREFQVSSFQYSVISRGNGSRGSAFVPQCGTTARQALATPLRALRLKTVRVAGVFRGDEFGPGGAPAAKIRIINWC